MSESSRQFMYGCNIYDDCPCPAMAAGFDPSTGDGSLEAAETYDRILWSDFVDNTMGTVDEETAKEAWERATEDMKNRYGEDSEFTEVAREIADELGWL